MNLNDTPDDTLDDVLDGTLTIIETPPEETAPKALRGFALLTPEQRSEIARMGGKKAWENGTAHRLTPVEARLAGRLGGAAISKNRKHMSTIGKKGALARKLKRETEGRHR